MGGQVASQQTPEPAEKPAVQVWNKGAPPLSSGPVTRAGPHPPTRACGRRTSAGSHPSETPPPEAAWAAGHRPALTIPESQA